MRVCVCACFFQETGELPVEVQLLYVKSGCSGLVTSRECRPSTTEAGSEVPTTGEEAETWRDLTALDRHHPQGPV